MDGFMTSRTRYHAVRRRSIEKSVADRLVREGIRGRADEPSLRTLRERKAILGPGCRVDRVEGVVAHGDLAHHLFGLRLVAVVDALQDQVGRTARPPAGERPQG